MHSSGNDYIYVDCFLESIDKPEELSITVSDRRKGIVKVLEVFPEKGKIRKVKVNMSEPILETKKTRSLQ